MKKIPWRLLLSMTFVAGVPAGLAAMLGARVGSDFVISLFSNLPGNIGLPDNVSLPQGINLPQNVNLPVVATDLKAHMGSVGVGLGIITCIVFIVLALLWYRRAMRRRDATFTLADASLYCTTSFELAVPPDEAFELALSALNMLPGFFAKRVSKATRRIEGVTGGGEAAAFSFGNPGERIRFVVGSRGANASYARVESRPDSFFVLVDFGRNRQNVNLVVNRLNEQVTRRYDEQRAAMERVQMERALTDAKLSALQAQVEPHFLYNTLANAQLLTRIDAKRADVMLGHLITYLRNALPVAGETMSTLGREVERSRAYLEILKIRMGARLKFAVDVPSTLENMPFPPLVVQTLVENCIKHGLEPKPGGGTVMICAEAHQDRLQITVADDGAGLQTGTSGTGLGLRNVRERLKLTFGDSAQCALAVNSPSGMKATISIPLSVAKT
jgi:signal transduction histidine kinase